MDSVHDVKRVLAWGNSYGIRLTKAELAQLGIQPGADVEVDVKPVRKKIDWSKVAIFRWGDNVSERHDEILYEGWLAQEEEEKAKPKQTGNRARRSK